MSLISGKTRELEAKETKRISINYRRERERERPGRVKMAKRDMGERNGEEIIESVGPPTESNHCH